MYLLLGKTNLSITSLKTPHCPPVTLHTALYDTAFYDSFACCCWGEENGRTVNVLVGCGPPAPACARHCNHVNVFPLCLDI